MTLGFLTGVVASIPGNLEPVVTSRNRRQGRLGSDSGVHSYGDYGIAVIKLVNKKSNASNDMYRNYLDYHTSVW